VLSHGSRLDRRRFAALIPTFKLPRRVRSLGGCFDEFRLASGYQNMWLFDFQQSEHRRHAGRDHRNDSADYSFP
ncbi:MAG: hypothetical protein WBC80_12525, partial [Isosphaeraceae bacterium]